MAVTAASLTGVQLVFAGQLEKSSDNVRDRVAFISNKSPQFGADKCFQPLAGPPDADSSCVRL